MTAASGWLSGHVYFFHWGVVQISLPNFLVIALMLLVFVLALVLPFPHGEDRVAAPAGEQETRDER